MERKESYLLYLLNKATHLIKWEINEGLKDYQLTSAQWRVLMDLKYQEKLNESEVTTTPALIAERLNVERPAITRAIDTLIKSGWVTKIDNPSDKRSQLIVLTEKSREILPQLKGVGDAVVAKTFKGFTAEEMQQLTDYLKVIIDNFCDVS